MPPAARLLALVATWLLWALPFALQRRRTSGVVRARTDPRARWGMALQGCGFALVYYHSPQVWATAVPVWRAVTGLVLDAVGIALAWSAVMHLGKQWRFDAGLNADHALVQTGAYRIVRHPIYASMLAMFLTVVLWLGTLPAWPIALALFLAGTEVRVRVEDALLARQFGARFTAWQRSVAAYVPFVR